jgi:hypothetical protein
LNETMYNAKAASARRKASVCATMNFMAVIEVGRAPDTIHSKPFKKSVDREHNSCLVCPRPKSIRLCRRLSAVPNAACQLRAWAACAAALRAGGGMHSRCGDVPLLCRMMARGGEKVKHGLRDFGDP